MNAKCLMDILKRILIACWNDSVLGNCAKQNIIKVSLPFFPIFSVTTGKFKIAFVADVVFLLASAPWETQAISSAT